MAKVDPTNYEANLISRIGDTMQLIHATLGMYQDHLEMLTTEYLEAEQARKLEEAEQLED